MRAFDGFVLEVVISAFIKILFQYALQGLVIDWFFFELNIGIKKYFQCTLSQLSYLNHQQYFPKNLRSNEMVRSQFAQLKAAIRKYKEN